MSLIELLELLGNDDHVCEYGVGRIESYNLDKNSMSGYDSSGNYKIIDLKSDDFDITQLISVSKVTRVWSENA